MSATLSATFRLVLRATDRHPYLVARLATRAPKLMPGELPLELTVTVPAALFKRPALRASVRVPDNVAAPVITTEVQDGIAAALSERLGLRVHVTTEPET